MKFSWVSVSRIALGTLFTLTGINGFFAFLPNPEMTPAAQSFMGALASTGYFFYLLKATELVSGVMLLTNRFVPLALLFLAPVVINIIAYHVFLQPTGLLLPTLATVLLIATAYGYRHSFREVLRARVLPGEMPVEVVRMKRPKRAA